eukprot:1179498-Prorocentrum_minimum.AAC.7
MEGVGGVALGGGGGLLAGSLCGGHRRLQQHPHHLRQLHARGHLRQVGELLDGVAHERLLQPLQVRLVDGLRGLHPPEEASVALHGGGESQARRLHRLPLAVLVGGVPLENLRHRLQQRRVHPHLGVRRGSGGGQEGI